MKQPKACADHAPGSAYPETFGTENLTASEQAAHAPEQISSMAAVDIYCTSGHVTGLRYRTKNWGNEYVAMCSCGWTGPAYSENDMASAVQACDIHIRNDDDGTSAVYGVRFTSPTLIGVLPGPYIVGPRN